MVIILGSEQAIFGDVSCQLVDTACTEGWLSNNFISSIRSMSGHDAALQIIICREGGRGVDLMQPAVVFLRVIDAAVAADGGGGIDRDIMPPPRPPPPCEESTKRA